MRSRFPRRLLAVACAAAVATLALPTPVWAGEGQAQELPAPLVRRSRARTTPPSRATPTRTAPTRTTPTRTTTSRVVHATGTPDARIPEYGTPYVRPARSASTPAASGPHTFRRAPAPVASPGHRGVAAPRTAVAPSPSGPVAAAGRTRHSTFVPPAGTARAASATPTRTVLAQGRSTYVPPSRPVALEPAPTPTPRGTVGQPTVRRTSPSYADLVRTQPQHVAARQAPNHGRAGTTTARTRRSTLDRSGLDRRTPTARRTLGRSAATPGRSTSVPAAAGEQVQPLPSTREQLPLRPRPGCCADG